MDCTECGSSMTFDGFDYICNECGNIEKSIATLNHEDDMKSEDDVSDICKNYSESQDN